MTVAEGQGAFSGGWTREINSVHSSGRITLSMIVAKQPAYSFTSVFSKSIILAEAVAGAGAVRMLDSQAAALSAEPIITDITITANVYRLGMDRTIRGI